jgi:alcohol dehydrogenase (NADP+)
MMNLYSRNLSRAVEFYSKIGFIETFRTPAAADPVHVELALDGFTLGIATVEAAEAHHCLIPEASPKTSALPGFAGRERQCAVATGQRAGRDGVRCGNSRSPAERAQPVPPLQILPFIRLDESDVKSRTSSARRIEAFLMTESLDFRITKLPLRQGAGHMPALGFGTLIPDAAVTISATTAALEAGFRHFDCAERYLNEREVGQALQARLAVGGIAREDLFVTTKLWNTNHRPERVEPAFNASLDRLRLDYLDLYLIHTPFAFQPGNEQDPRDQNGNIVYDRDVTLLDTWRAMESLVDRGRCRAIGLSDINLDGLLPIYESARIKPAVVQVESHPYLPETELLEFCRAKGIVVLAFAPLGHGMRPGPLEDPVILATAARVGKTPAQVLLAWAVQRGTALLTTPRSADRARENFNISALPQDAFDEINRIQIRQRLNDVVNTGSPGFIPRVKSA